MPRVEKGSGGQGKIGRGREILRTNGEGGRDGEGEMERWRGVLVLMVRNWEMES